MEKVLFIAYQFPPRGGPGVQRSMNFIKHLKENGYDPIVLTVNVDDIKKAGHLYDGSLLTKIPADVNVVRVPAHEPIKLIRFLMKVRVYRIVWFFFYSYFWEWSASWPRKTFATAKKLVEEHNIRLVYTSSGPFSTIILGHMLKKRLNLKWVADLRDPFTDAYAWQFPSKLHWYLSRRFEKKYFSKADKLIVNTPEVRKLYIKRELADDKNIVCITNGY